MNWEEDGVSQKSRLEQVWSQTGKKPKELELERLPFELSYLREVFWDLWSSEGWSWSEVYYHGLVRGIPLDEAEIMIVRGAFGVCSRFVKQKMSNKSKGKNKSTSGGGK